MSNMAIMCRCVEISLLGCVEQNVVQNVPSLTRFLPYCVSGCFNQAIVFYGRTGLRSKRVGEWSVWFGPASRQDAKLDFSPHTVLRLLHHWYAR